ncbi:hypothetical protein WMY93_011635 [Mugilogobius chulae]|uniref:Uncharacterized protein n=1 Tax=Mugilogobius chulae TaxID=88201 RepID=A0AAW0P711_9GOBI
MAHNEIRRLTDELESAHNIQRAYEPELKAAKCEVDQLRQEVEQLKKYGMMSLRKAKEQNDRLDREIQCLRSRLRVAMETEEDFRQQGALLTKLQSAQCQTDPAPEPEEVINLRRNVENLQSALKEQQTRTEKTKELNESLEAKVNRNNEVCGNLQGQIEAQMKHALQQESEIEALKLELENLQREKEDLQQMHLKFQLLQLQENQQNLVQKQDYCDSVSTQQRKKEIYFDQEQRKNLEMQETLKLKLRHAKLKLKDETKWRDEKIEDLERDLSLCSHAVTLEKELNMNIMMENDKLLIERRRLMQQLNEEVNNNQKNISSALQSRIDFLEMENRELQNRIVDMSAQISSLERSLQNILSLRAARRPVCCCRTRPVAPAASGRSRDVVTVFQFSSIRRDRIPQPELLPQPLSAQLSDS